jgi:hypothetical protein
MAPRMPGTEQRDPLPTIERELATEFSRVVPPDVIRDVARASLDEFRHAKVKDYVPILARRRARSRLRSQSTNR